MISLNFKTLAQTPFFLLSVSWSGFGWVLLVCSYSAPYITKLKLSICVFKHLKDSGMCVCVCVCVCVSRSFVSDSAMSWTVDSSVHGILQARILEWVTIPFSKGSYQSKDQIEVPCITGRFFTVGATREASFAFTCPVFPAPKKLSFLHSIFSPPSL